MDHAHRSRDAYGRSAELHLSAVGSTVSSDFETDDDLDVLTRFTRLTGEVGGLVLDAGCGTGRIARRLAESGLKPIGVDVAPGMVDVAQREHPDLPFVVGELARLPVADATLAGAAYWYSIITTPPAVVSPLWTELTRVLVPEGVALIAFQSGRGEAVERPDAYGTGVDLTLYRHDVDLVTAGLEATSLDIIDVVERAPVLDHEDTPQAFVLARNSAQRASAGVYSWNPNKVER